MALKHTAERDEWFRTQNIIPICVVKKVDSFNFFFHAYYNL